MQGHPAIAASDQPHYAIGISGSQRLHGHHPVRPADITTHGLATNTTSDGTRSRSIPSTLRTRTLKGINHPADSNPAPNRASELAIRTGEERIIITPCASGHRCHPQQTGPQPADGYTRS